MTTKEYPKIKPKTQEEKERPSKNSSRLPTSTSTRATSKGEKRPSVSRENPNLKPILMSNSPGVSAPIQLFNPNHNLGWSDGIRKARSNSKISKSHPSASQRKYRSQFRTGIQSRKRGYRYAGRKMQGARQGS